MKKMLLLPLLVMLSFNALSQASKMDVIVKTNGEEMKGKVVRVTDSDVVFVYDGETAEYTLKKSDIAKITHASGRVETFSQQSLPARARQNEEVAMSPSPADHHNKIAVLPFTYLIDNQPGADAVGYKAQEDAYAYLSKHSAGYTILDPRTTNTLLSKAGITKDKMMNFTMKEICDALGVEYIVDGSVMQNKGYQTSSTSGGASSTVKRDGDGDVKKVNTYGSSNSSTAQRYDVGVSIHIYMDNNASIYNQSRKALLSNTDGAYGGPLEYLLKRCPLYRK